MWKLSIEDDQGNKTVVKLVRDEYTVGRAEDNAIRLTERNISRRHASIRKNGSSWMVLDRSSYNGCFVNGARVNQTARLEHGDLIQVGDYRLTVLDERLTPMAGVAGESEAPGGHPDSPLGQPDRFVMLVGPTPGAEFALGSERVVIGRGEECDIAINHSSVSRVHAELHPLGQGRFEIIDLDSSNGVRINGIELQRSLIHPRDVIELGDVILKFIPAGEFYKPSAEESQQIGALSAGLLEPTRVVPTSAKIVAAVVGLGLLLVLGLILFGRNSSTPAPETTAVVRQTEKTARSLTEARSLLESGNVLAAHEKVLADIPDGSNARESREFKEIESRWAELMLERAAGESDVARKRELLEQVARATTVDNLRRKRAHAELEKLGDADGDDSLDVNELPSVPRAQSSPSAVTASSQVGAAPAPSPGASAAAPAPAAPDNDGAVADGLVRANPFGDDEAREKRSDARASEVALTGDRRQILAAKNSLKAKAANGTASEQELRLLRSLCRQLDDASCSE